MIILPKEHPVVVNLNSYFLKIDKLVEHYQGEVGTGSIYFKAPASEAVIFFDEANLINSYYFDKKNHLLGKQAFDKIIETSSVNNFSVSVYRINPQRLYYWASQAHAESLYSDLHSEVTDLDALIQRLEGEKLNGYIEIKFKQNGAGGYLFLFNGQVIGGVSEKGDGTLNPSMEFQNQLRADIKKNGAVFQVKKIELNIKPISLTPAPPLEPVPAGPKSVAPLPREPERTQENKPAFKPVEKPLIKAKPNSHPKNQKDVHRVLEMLEALLSLLERVIQSNRKLKVDFETLLNKKFVEKANKYDFLDPFFDEFKYLNGRIEYTGNAGPDELISAITECVREIVSSLGVVETFRKYLESWKKGFAKEIMDFDIDI